MIFNEQTHEFIQPEPTFEFRDSYINNYILAFGTDNSEITDIAFAAMINNKDLQRVLPELGIIRIFNDNSVSDYVVNNEKKLNIISIIKADNHYNVLFP